MRMMQAVKDADVIITNPTHYAIALSYKEDKNGAPIVVAKGKDYLAQKIKERARECSVEIVENRQLARALYFFCNVGDEVPEDLYKAVAEVLAYVYRMKKGGRRS
jgi:flagellar biosynthetic protein FlhB